MIGGTCVELIDKSSDSLNERGVESIKIRLEVVSDDNPTRLVPRTIA